MNRINQRLTQLEREAALHAVREAGRFEASQKDLACPLPASSTPSEVAAALRLQRRPLQGLQNQNSRQPSNAIPSVYFV